MKISEKGMEMVALPLLEMLKSSVVHEEPINHEAKFMKNLVGAFMPVTDSKMVLGVKGILVDIAVISANREPEKVREKLIALKVELDGYLI